MHLGMNPALDLVAAGGDNPPMNRLFASGFRRLATLLAGLLLLYAALLPARAADNRPYIPFPKERYRIFVFGDKMATGLLAGLWRVLKDNPKYVARGRFRAGTGLVRLKYYDWQRAIAQVVESRPVDIAIVMLGINDVRDIFLNGQRIPFGSAKWKRIYATRIKAIIDTLKNADVALYWVGLPPVRNPALDAGARVINAIIREQTQAAGVRFIPIRRHFVGADGRYSEAGRDVHGQVVRLRARNGVHFIRPGNTKLARIVMGVIEKDVRATESSTGTPTLPGMEETDKPYVGKAGPDGNPVYVAPAALPGTNEVYLAHKAPEAGGAGGILQALREAAQPGSAAERLFTEGAWPQAPLARLDNFALPPASKENRKPAPGKSH